MIETVQTKILVIDDDEAIRSSIKYYLEDLGYQVLTAENGRIGIEVFDREDPELVLVDLRMPEINGLEVLAYIKKTSPDTPSIVISGSGIIADAIEALHQGAWDYVLKPIENMSVLNHTVKNTLTKARLRQENLAYRKDLEYEVANRTEELYQLNRRLRAMVDSTRVIAACSTLKDLARRLLEEFAKNMAAEGGSLYLVKDGGLVLGHTLDSTHAIKLLSLPMSSHTILGKALEKNKPILINDISRENNIKPSGWTGYKDGSLLAFPFFDKQSRPLGVIALHNKKHPPFTKQDMEIGMVLASYSCEAIKAANAMESLQKRLMQIQEVEKEKKNLAKQLQQAQRMESIGTLAGGIAHDFNNILGSILGFTELSLGEVQKGSSLERNLNGVYDAGLRASELVQQILTFSRQTEQELKPVQVSLIVKEALKLLRASLPATIEIRQEIKSDGLIMGDPTRVHQVLMNLCTNAGHAMEEHGGVLVVSLSNMELYSDFTDKYPELNPGPYLRLMVSDTGYGIRPEILDKIFDPFFTTKEKHEGTGMGLSVVHGIVKGYGGVVYAESGPGKGTRFKVLLPAVERKTESEERTNIPLAKGTEHILFVDDEEYLIDIGKKMLESLGYKVMTSTSGSEALRIFSDHPNRFDLVITDLTMPVIKGDELAKKLIAVRPDLPVILCTGFSSKIKEETAMASGIKAFVMKPFLMRDIAETVRRVLDKK